MKLSIIIIHWNTPQALEKQLNNLGLNKDIEIIVVDNNSTHKLDKIKEKFIYVKFVENTINHGYAFACNQGAVSGIGEWLLFLNPDVSIIGDQTIDLLKKTQENQLDASSPNIKQVGYQKPLASFKSLLLEFSPLGKILPNSSKEKTLFGGCLLIKKAVFNQIGGWDERFFLWFEDCDLTKKLYDNNFKVGWVESNIKHEGALSFQKLTSNTKRQIFFHSLRVYTRKYFNPLQQLVIRLIIHRFATNNILPTLDDSTTLIIPNLRRELLDSFLTKNLKFNNSQTELVIVTSALKREDFLGYKNKYPNIRFILLDKNDGFAKTVNIGLCVSRGEWTGTVNDDTFWTMDWVSKCVSATDNSTGSINPLIYDTENKIESAGINVLPFGKAIPITSIPSSEISFVDATNGASVLYRHSVLERTDLYDERFGSYLEDIDLSLRIKRQGYTNSVVKSSKITHLKHQTSKSKQTGYKNWHDFKNWILIILKNWTLSQWIINFPQICIERLRNLSGIVKVLFT